jgi:hypothetical protein
MTVRGLIIEPYEKSKHELCFDASGFVGLGNFTQSVLYAGPCLLSFAVAEAISVPHSVNLLYFRLKLKLRVKIFAGV